MVRTVREYDRVDGLTEGQLAILEKINARFKGGPVYDWAGRATIRWKSFVGIIRVGDVTLEILPKIHRHTEDEGADRTYLLRMLAESGTLPITLQDVAAFATQQWTLLDLVIYAFSLEARQQLHKGRVHRYVVTKEDRSALRGKLLVAEHAVGDPVRQLRFPCQFAQFTANNPINRLLRTAAREGMRLTRHPVVRQSLSWVEQQFDDVDLLSRPYTRTCPDIVHDRTTSRYARACTLAEQILRGIAPHVHSGKTEYFAMLFDMNVLFEQWVAARYQREHASADVHVSAQESTMALFRGANRRAFWLKPDIVIRDRAHNNITVIDTKWKLLASDKSYFGVSQADAYQMFAYMERYKAQRVLLMYPHHPGLGVPVGKQAEYSHADGNGRLLEVWTIDVDRHQG